MFIFLLIFTDKGVKQQVCHPDNFAIEKRPQNAKLAAAVFKSN